MRVARSGPEHDGRGERRWVRWVVVLGFGALATSACGASGDTDDGPVPLLVFAAASFSNALADAEAEFEAMEPNIDVRLNLAGSSALRVQIFEGAPADVYISADESNMVEVIESGAATTSTVFARNTMQLAVPAGNPAGVRGVADLADADLLIGLCAENVPCGDYARRVLSNADIVPSLDTNEADVRSLMTKIGAGELDVGMVYASDVAVADDVDGLDIPTEFNVVTTAPVAVLTATANPAAANAFVDFLLSGPGQAILIRNGFTT